MSEWARTPTSVETRADGDLKRTRAIYGRSALRHGIRLRPIAPVMGIPLERLAI
jgi:hypothetical protein